MSKASKYDPALVAILVNRELSRLSSQVKTLEKVLRAPYSDKERQRLLTLAANWRALLAFARRSPANAAPGRPSHEGRGFFHKALATGFCRKIFNGRGEKMKATDFEDKVWEIEGIRIVLRCPPNTEVSGYDYKNAADQNSSVSEWLKGRVLPKINDISVDVIAGNGEQPHGRSLLRTVRSSYAKD